MKTIPLRVMTSVWCFAFCLLLGTTESVWASSIEITFEEVEEGVRVSYSASIDLSEFQELPEDIRSLLFDSSEEEPFFSGILLNALGAAQFSFEGEEPPTRAFGVSGTFRFINDSLFPDFLDVRNASQETGDLFAFNVLGSAAPFLSVFVPEDYVSGDLLSGSIVLADLNRSDIVGLTGTRPLDFQGNIEASFKVLPEANLEVTDFTFEAESGMGLVQFSGEPGVRYQAVFSPTLDFTEAVVLSPESVLVGESFFLDGAWTPNELGLATVSFSLPQGEQGFLRVQAARLEEPYFSTSE